MRLIHRFLVTCGLLTICSCSRSDSDEVTKLKAEFDAAKAEAAAARAELGKLKEAINEQEGKQPRLRLAPRLTGGGAPSLAPAPGQLFPGFRFFQWPEGLTVLIVQQAWARTTGGGDFYSNSGGVWDAAGEQRYEWRLQTTDGKTGTFRIVPGKEYDLSKGGLFVIKGYKGYGDTLEVLDKVEVHQLSRQLPTAPLDAKGVEEYHKNDAEVRKILGTGK